jgi:hypothetical protein
MAGRNSQTCGARTTLIGNEVAMKKHFYILLLVLLISISACAPIASNHTGVNKVDNSTPLPPTTIPVLELPAATPTASPTVLSPKPEATVFQKMIKKCLKVEWQIPDDLALSGVWVINPGFPKLKNLDDQMFYGVPLKGGGSLRAYRGNLAISPSGQHMAYIDSYLSGYPTRTEKRVLRVIRSSGHSLDMSYWPEEWQSVFGWVDDQNVYLYTSRNEIVILNPLTGVWRIFEQPEWMEKPDDYSYGYWRSPNLSPNLEWALDRSEKGKIAIRNVQTGETVWEKNADPWTEWKWSSDNTTTAIASEETIYVVVNGQQTAEFDLDALGYSRPYNVALSFDGQKLAFGTSTGGGYDRQLTIIDIAEHKLIRLCDGNYRSAWDGPIWSPDGRFLLQKVHHNSRYETFDVLVDTQTLRAYFSESGYYEGPIAWLAKP